MNQQNNDEKEKTTTKQYQTRTEHQMNTPKTTTPMFHILNDQ